MLIGFMKTINDLYDTFGGSGAVAKVIRVKPSAASEMRRRKSIPVKYWPYLLKEATATGLNLTNDILVRLHVSGQ